MLVMMQGLFSKVPLPLMFTENSMAFRRQEWG